MELRDAHMLRTKWDGRSCSHSITVEETISGTPTGNVACIYCGIVFKPENLEESLEDTDHGRV